MISIIIMLCLSDLLNGLDLYVFVIGYSCRVGEGQSFDLVYRSAIVKYCYSNLTKYSLKIWLLV